MHTTQNSEKLSAEYHDRRELFGNSISEEDHTDDLADETDQNKKAYMELSRLLAAAERNVINKEVAPIVDTFDNLRALLKNDRSIEL